MSPEIRAGNGLPWDEIGLSAKAIPGASPPECAARNQPARHAHGIFVT